MNMSQASRQVSCFRNRLNLARIDKIVSTR